MELFRKISDNPSIVWINGEVVAERIDADYYHANHIQLNKSKIPMFKISTYCYLSKKRFNPNKYNKEYFKYIDISNVDNNTGVFEYQLVNINEAPSRARKKVSKNDIIISTVRPNRNAVAIVNIEDDELVVSTGFAVIECKKNIDSYYLFAVLKTSNSIGQLVRKTSGGLYPAVSEQDVMEIEIPIPSPEIQKYIGDKVRKAEELREEAKRLKKEAEEILNKELNLKDVEFYIKQANNKKYSWTESIEIEDRIDSEFYKPKYRYLSKLNNMSELSYYYKISKKRINKNIDRKIKYIDLSSVNNIIEPSDFNTKELPSRAQFLVKEGNLIISTLKGSNKISIIPEHLNDSVCSTGFIVIASKSHLTTEYLYLVFSNKVFNMQIERYSTGSIMSGVNHDNFNKMLIPVISNKQIIDTITNKIRKHFRLLYYSKQLIQEAKQDVEDLIEGNFDMSKVKANN